MAYRLTGEKVFSTGSSRRWKKRHLVANPAARLDALHAFAETGPGGLQRRKLAGHRHRHPWSGGHAGYSAGGKPAGAACREGSRASAEGDRQHCRRLAHEAELVHSQQLRPNESVGVADGGLIRACIVLGKENHQEEYELGVGNMLKALDAQGPQGEFYEGIGYANFTVTSMLHAAHAMAAAGDRRAIDHAFLRRFPTWMAHHLQPGRFRVNCFDAGRGEDAADGSGLPRNSVAVPAVDERPRRPVDAGTPILRSQRRSDRPCLPVQPPVPRKNRPSSPPTAVPGRVNWRSGWSDDASGVWIRGGHPLDGHDHHDRGHVNFNLPRQADPDRIRHAELRQPQDSYALFDRAGAQCAGGAGSCGEEGGGADRSGASGC